MSNVRIDTTRLRATIGWLGMLLPWIVVALVCGFPPSISATYYTNAGAVFTIILGSASVLLICYRGYELIDDITFTASGIFGLGICLFPCYTDELSRVGTFQIPVEISSIIHNVCAAGFFILLSSCSLFLFTKTDGEMTKKKKIRNLIYIVCGIGMVLSFALFLLPDFGIKVWLIETIALFFFGVSFLTKANIYKFLFAGD